MSEHSEEEICRGRDDTVTVETPEGSLKWSRVQWILSVALERCVLKVADIPSKVDFSLITYSLAGSSSASEGDCNDCLSKGKCEYIVHQTVQSHFSCFTHRVGAVNFSRCEFRFFVIFFVCLFFCPLPLFLLLFRNF